QIGDELAAKQPAQDLDRQEETRAADDPLRIVCGQTAAWNHAMQMWMSLQGLPPCMEHDEETNLGAQVLRISGDFQQGLGSCAKEQVVNDSFVLQSQKAELFRQGEHDMEIAHRQEFLSPARVPQRAPASTRLWLRPDILGNGGRGRSCTQSADGRTDRIVRYGHPRRQCDNPQCSVPHGAGLPAANSQKRYPGFGKYRLVLSSARSWLRLQGEVGRQQIQGTGR